jgi:hypothetical protein
MALVRRDHDDHRVNTNQALAHREYETVYMDEIPSYQRREQPHRNTHRTESRRQSNFSANHQNFSPMDMVTADRFFAGDPRYPRKPPKITSQGGINYVEWVPIWDQYPELEVNYGRQNNFSERMGGSRPAHSMNHNQRNEVTARSFGGRNTHYPSGGQSSQSSPRRHNSQPSQVQLSVRHRSGLAQSYSSGPSTEEEMPRSRFQSPPQDMHQDFGRMHRNRACDNCGELDCHPTFCSIR